jgi:hypothetical protein
MNLQELVGRAIAIICKMHHIILYQKLLKFARVYDMIVLEKDFFYIL